MNPVTSAVVRQDTLSTPQPLRAGQGGATLKAEVASTLARCLLERHEWERPVAIDSKAIDQLLASPALRGTSNPQWELQTDAHAMTR